MMKDFSPCFSWIVPLHCRFLSRTRRLFPHTSSSCRTLNPLCPLARQFAVVSIVEISLLQRSPFFVWNVSAQHGNAFAWHERNRTNQTRHGDERCASSSVIGVASSSEYLVADERRRSVAIANQPQSAPIRAISRKQRGLPGSVSTRS
jgi:hypothetical protein